MASEHLEETRQREHIQTHLFDDAEAACREAAREVAELIRKKAEGGEPAVLGLATGSSPVRLYRELIRLHREEGLSFKNVVTFNLDEYYGLGPDHPESYRRFMQDQLFDHVDIPAENTHVPDGLIPRESVFDHCRAYEEAIRKLGGLDLQILGIGRTGHIGFNEPGSGPDSRTRLVTLDTLTRRDAARDFLGEENVPRHAITMGVGTILEAQRILLLAWGQAKADVIARSAEDPPTENIPASFLQGHGDCRFFLDSMAGSLLTRIRHPWLVGPVAWTPETTRSAVLWLSRKVQKPILKLVDEDYTENGMADLLTERGSAYNLNIEQFNRTQHTITGWPGGKPDADDSHRPERATPYPKRCLVLSPEPLDDVLAMGGTLHRLVDQGHELTVAYLASGNLAVSDTEVEKALDWNGEIGGDRPTRVEDLDTAELRRWKAIIRRSEARASARILGIPPDQLVFLDLPFYENSRYRRFVAGPEDTGKLRELIETIRPHQIFTTGLGHDPLTPAAIGFEIFLTTLRETSGQDWQKDCRIWLYHGQGQEWDAHELEMAVPLSPEELENKIQGIYQHQTQRSQTPSFKGRGSREAWHLADQLNRHTAEQYDQLGLAEYEAIEGFARFSIPDTSAS
jgi:glucosamine-6-phosphate deaminase